MKSIKVSELKANLSRYLRISPLPRAVDAQAALQDVREDPDEVRRRQRNSSNPPRV